MKKNSEKNRKFIHSVSRMNDILFWLFGFCYLYFLQGDLLSLKIRSYLPSGNLILPIWGWAVIIIGILWGLQRIVKKIGYSASWYTLSYVPSYLILGCITYYKDRYDFPLPGVIMIGIIGITLMSFLYWRKKSVNLPNSLIEVLTFNLLQIILSCLITLSIGNTNEDLHREIAMKEALDKKNYSKVLTLGKKSLSVTPLIASYRLEALLETDKTGDYLFEYPQHYQMKDLQVGIFQNPKMAFDKDIISLLLAKELKASYRKIIHGSGKYYKDSLPRYYKETLILYNYLYPDSITRITSSILKDNFREYLKEQTQVRKELNGANCTDIEKNIMRRKYGNTYWWYYQYGY